MSATQLLADQAVQAPSIDYAAIAPILIVLGAACLSVLIEAFLPRHQRWSVQVVLVLATLTASVIALAAYIAGAPSAGTTTLAGVISVDRPTLFLWGTLLALGIGCIFLIADRSVEPGGYFVAQAALRPGTIGDRLLHGGSQTPLRTETHRQMQTEVFPLTLFSLGGMMVFVAANDLLTMFVALEVLSLPLYLLCGL
ncbi:MAG: NADH-quinone oxidoreductase subunit NuoN, partial [Sciscionella sp.]